MSSSQRLPLRILTIDGGGVRGVVPLRILQSLCEEAGGKQPHELFDLICGTSTGGILAYLLGVLKLPVSECNALYEKLGNEVFNPSWFARIWNGLSEKAQFSGDKMEELVQSELKSRGYPSDLKMNDPAVSAPPNIRVFAVSSRDRLPFRLRNYHDCNSAEGTDNVKFWEAIRATSAAPLYFPPITIAGQVYCDGGMGTNNPINQALQEVPQIKGWEGRPIGIVVSLGTGKANYVHNTGSLKGIPAYLAAVSTDCESTHEDLEARRSALAFRYERFNPDGGVGSFNLSDVKNLPAMVGGTEAYLKNHSVYARIKEVASLLTNAAQLSSAKKPPATLSEATAQLLVAQNNLYTGEGVDMALMRIKQLQDRHPYPKFAQEYTHIAAQEKAKVFKHEWTQDRQKLYKFWENFVTLFADRWSSEVILTGAWIYRAIEYLKYNELMDATNYYRWRLDEQKPDPADKPYWRHRPRSYEMLSEMLVRIEKRNPNEDIAVQNLVEGELKTVVLASLEHPQL